MDNPKIENILVPQAVAEYKQALKNVGVPSSFLEPFADKDFEESVYVRFSEALGLWERAVGEAMTEDTATNLVDDELVQHDVAMALRRTCAAELWEGSAPRARSRTSASMIFATSPTSAHGSPTGTVGSSNAPRAIPHAGAETSAWRTTGSTQPRRTYTPS